MSGVRWPVRWYYDVWGRLPEVRAGLFGRGVIALSESGHERVATLPPLMSDDLAAALAFEPGERAIVPGARVVIHPPRTVGDLLRRRVRVATGVTQIEHDRAAPESTARTRSTDLLAIIKQAPWMTPQVAVFATVTILARLQAARVVRRGDYSTWRRDESSRRAN
jgi:hypothetical protein